MATDADIDEIKRMCVLLFLELQEIRRKLEIEPVGSRDRDEYQIAVPGHLTEFENKMRHLVNVLPQREA
ncbi:hypothetical protein [Lysobacter niastensis]|uniref:Uncharacterized protein n=1 Tax=Lysobacter niastensis TaxID=380629 RepID=A0ABS0B719_9GAMM|nr:hypothetical protein [Lysobacter niastensis]MBF6024826.1 hypothetical protein [Lysobacter niastensis]